MTLLCDTDTIVEKNVTPVLELPPGLPPLTTLYVYVAGSCNLACQHCWIVPKYQPDGDGGPYIKLEYVEKAIREAKPLGLRSVKLTGGEPLLHPRFRELVTMINDAGLEIPIETNGTLIDDSMARFLKNLSHVCFISVSLDGKDAKTHDMMRSVPGSFERTTHAIESLVRVGIHPQVICSLHSGNVAQLDEVVAMAERLQCNSVKFNLIQAVGRGERFSEEKGLGIQEILDLNEHVERDLVPQSKISIYFDIPRAFYSIRRLLGDSGRCSIGNILGILATGELSICGIGTNMPELVYGHVATDSVGQVWCTSPGLMQLREQIPAQLEGVCGVCLFRDTCLGSCIANNYNATGKLNAPYQFCDRAEGLSLFPTARKKTQ